jgi:hypothetical protein
VGYFPKEWLVFFYDPPNHEWYHQFRKDGMAHCGIIGYYPKKDKWLAVEHIHRRLDLNIIEGEELDRMLSYVLQHKGRILKCKTFRHKWRLFQAAWLREHSCVTVVMRVLGINRLIITPYQLYKYLKKQGCEQWDF